MNRSRLSYDDGRLRLELIRHLDRVGTQRRLAAKIGISESNLSRYVAGDRPVGGQVLKWMALQLMEQRDCRKT